MAARELSEADPRADRHANQILRDDYRCPECLGNLAVNDAQLVCTNCNAAYPVADGITDFRCHRKDYYFNPVSSADMDVLIRGMTPENWPETIRGFLARMKRFNPQWLDNLVVDGRYSWKILLNLSPETVLLDLGCGLGNLTKNLAPHVAKVYAMDLTYRRLEFSRKRFSIFNPSDAISLLAAGDGAHLPFPDDHLDCVVLSGVLEWVGEGDIRSYLEGSKASRLWKMLAYQFGGRGPRAIQRQFLKEIRRVLKPTGQLFIAIENRLNYEYFGGRPDHHSNLKFGSLLPRTVANVYSILMKRRPYRTYTYSIPGYRRLLREAGFPEIDFFGLSKGYSDLEEILPADAHMPRWRSTVPASWKDRIRRNRLLVPAYGIVASAAKRPWPRLQDRLLAQIEDQLESGARDDSLTIREYRVTSKEKLIIRASSGANNLIIRIPLNDAASISEANNAMLLNHIRNNRKNVDWCPLPLMEGEAAGLRYYVEQEASGVRLADALRSNGRLSMLSAVAGLVDELTPQAVQADVCQLTADLYDAHVSKPLRALSLVLEDQGIRNELDAFFRENLYGIDVTLGVTHGDLSVDNILIDKGRVSGVIDWEAGSIEGLPVLDAITYSISVFHLFHPGAGVPVSIPALASKTGLLAQEWEFLERCYSRYRFEPARHAALVYLCWLQAMQFRLRFSLAYNPAAIEFYVHKVVKQLLTVEAED